MKYKKIILGGFFFGYSLRLSKFICFEWDSGSLNIHFFKWFMRIKNTEKHPLLFSERNGYVPITKLGKYCITVRVKKPDGINQDTLHNQNLK